MVRILGIDPGTSVVGFACLEVAMRARRVAHRPASPSRGAVDAATGGATALPASPDLPASSDLPARPARPVPLAARAGNIVRLGPGRAGPGQLIDSGALRLGRKASIPARLAQLASELEQILERLRPDELAVEEAFFGKSVQSAMRIGEARGVVLAAAHRFGVEIHQYPPARIKRAVTGSGRADKDTVAEFVARQLGLQSIEGPRDVTDAVAVAWCRAEECRGQVHAASPRRM